MNIQKTISYIIKLFWIIALFLVVFLDRENQAMIITTIILLLFISIITVLRSINSRNEWRKMIEDGEVEIKDKISFDK